jgi:hypothetical protein
MFSNDFGDGSSDPEIKQAEIPDDHPGDAQKAEPLLS